MVRYKALAPVKDTLMSLASFSNTSDGLVLWDGAEFCSQDRNLSMGARRNSGGWLEKAEWLGRLKTGPRTGK